MNVSEWSRLHSEGLSWAQIAERDGSGLSANAIRKRVRKSKEAPPSGEPSALPAEQLVTFADGRDIKGDIIFEDRVAQPTDADVEHLLGAYLTVMDSAKKFKTSQREATITLNGNLPVGLVFFGDQHTGSWSWAARRMLEDYKLASEADGLYINFLGDDFDNFIFNFAKWASVMTPDHQRRITEYLMKKIYEKTLSVVAGNHLHWTKKAVDFDLNARLAMLSNAVYLGHRGDLHIKVGAQEYHGHLGHRVQGVSVLNKSNSGRRTADDIGGADFIVEGDRHEPWLHQEYKARKRQVWLRSGTYKMDDDYTDEIGFPQGKWDMPCIVLLPDEHKIIPYLDFRDGLSHLRLLREEYRHKGG